MNRLEYKCRNISEKGINRELENTKIATIVANTPSLADNVISTGMEVIAESLDGKKQIDKHIEIVINLSINYYTRISNLFCMAPIR